MPDEDYLAEQMSVVDVDGIHEARDFVRRELAEALYEPLLSHYQAMNDGRPYDKAPAAIARRSLKNACLSFLALTARRRRTGQPAMGA